MRVAVPFAKNVYVTILSRIHGKGVAITEKGITLVISIQDMDDINWIIKSLEKLINGVSEIVKHKIKRGIFWYAIKNFENMDVFQDIFSSNDKIFILGWGLNIRQ